MHEAGIIHNILGMAEDTARKYNAKRILKLRVRVGSMSGVVVEALQFAFDAMRINTLAEEAELEIEVVPARCRCKNCQIDYEPEDEINFLCPECGGGNIELRSGRELELVSIDYC